MERSRTLREYSVYVQRIRNNKAFGMYISEAVDKATKDSIRDGILKDILVKNSAEVKNMVLGTWGTENHIRKQNEEMERLKRETAEWERKLAIHKYKIAEQEREIAEQEQELAEQERELAKREQKITEQEQENIVLKKRKSAENELAQRLLGAGEIEKLKRALADEAYRQKLLEEHQLDCTSPEYSA